MNRIKHLTLIVGLALGLSFSAAADPGAGVFTNAQNATFIKVVGISSGTLVYAFTTAVDSISFNVTASRADLCFDTDRTSAATGAARISVYRAIDPANIVTVASILLPAVPIDERNCLELVPGRYWIDVTTGRSASQEPIVTITGRSK